MAQPDPGTGKLHYIEIPATDVAASSAFYRDVFGWNIRSRGDGATAFDDASGAISGVWSTTLIPNPDTGFRLYISVEDALAQSAVIEAAGGSIVQVADPAAVDVVALFRDPAGNVLGIHQYNPGNA